MFLVGHTADQLQTAAADIHYRAFLQLQLQLACLDFGQIQDIVDQLQQMSPAFLDGVQRLELFFVNGP